MTASPAEAIASPRSRNGAKRRAPPHPAAADTLLYLDGVTVSFDGFRALNGLSLVIAKGELRTVIGPNGAGKTTMMDVVTGKTRADEGVVFYDGAVDLTRLDETGIANLGVGRKFQKPTVFETLTVLENLELALAGPRGTFSSLFARLTPAARARIDEVLAIVDLGAKAASPAGALSHGQKQWLEIGMLLIHGPELLLLDEPVAGMTDVETEATVTLIRELNRSRTIVVVEHDMQFVRALGAKVTVLHEGSVLAEGGIDFVQNDPRVIEVYLGR